MPTLREKFDIRPVSKGITGHGSKHVISNQLGRHVYHVGEIVDLHCHQTTIHVRIIGSVNTHLIGEIRGCNANEINFENMQSGQKITFDEDNIFDYYET